MNKLIPIVAMVCVIAAGPVAAEVLVESRLDTSTHAFGLSATVQTVETCLAVGMARAIGFGQTVQTACIDPTSGRVLAKQRCRAEFGGTAACEAIPAGEKR
jgi:hypothetical protein